MTSTYNMQLTSIGEAMRQGQSTATATPVGLVDTCRDDVRLHRPASRRGDDKGYQRLPSIFFHVFTLYQDDLIR